MLRIKRVRVEVKIPDLWIGAFWRWDDITSFRWPDKGWQRGLYTPEAQEKGLQLDVWICLLPCLPLHVELVKIIPPARIRIIEP